MSPESICQVVWKSGTATRYNASPIATPSSEVRLGLKGNQEKRSVCFVMFLLNLIKYTCVTFRHKVHNILEKVLVYLPNPLSFDILSSSVDSPF